MNVFKEWWAVLEPSDKITVIAFGPFYFALVAVMIKLISMAIF